MKRWPIILLFGLAACYSERKARNQFAKAAVAYPLIPVEYCAEQFPDKPDSVIVKTDTVTEILFMDSLVFNTDTLYKDSLGFKYRTITKVVTKTIRKDSIIYRLNTAEQERLRLQLNKCQDNNNVVMTKNLEQEKLIASWKKKAKDRWLWIALLIGGAVAFTIFKVAKGLRPKL